MAISLTSDISNVLTTAFGPDLVRLWNRRANTLANCVQIEEGEMKQVFWAASTAAGASKAVAEAYQFQSSDFNADAMVPLALPRAQYVDPFSLSDSEIAIAARSRLSPNRLFDMVGERIFESATRLTSRINKDLLQGNGVDGVSGAQAIVGLESALITSGSYAGQNVGSVVDLQSNISGADASGAAVTLAQLQSDLTAIKLRSDEKPEFIVCHPYVSAQLQSLFETNRRIVSFDSGLTRYATGPSAAFNGADSGLEYMGIKILNDKDGYVQGTPGSGTGHIYYLSKRHLVVDVMPHVNPMDGSVWEDQSFLSSGGWADDSVSAPVISIVSLAKNGLNTTFALNVECQLKVKNTRALGIRKGVNI